MAVVNGTALSVMGDQSQAAPQEETFRNHRNLVHWVVKENDGYLHPDVRIAHSQEKGFHMIVAEGKIIKALTRVTSCPMTTTLSVLNALDVAPFRSHGSKFPAAFLKTNAKKPQLLQAFFLMDQFVKGDESWWAPYIKTLPTPKEVKELDFDSPGDQLWLEGTNLKAAMISLHTAWQDMYTTGLRQLKILNWRLALDGSYSWELFRWAATMFGSRSFTSEILTDTEPADQVRMEGHGGVPESQHYFLKSLFVEHFAVLLPLLDILNHRPIAQVEWQPRSSFVGMQILSSFESGEELCNNYGPRDNETLLLSYGFIIPDNPFDHVAVALKPPPTGSPLATARKDWKQDLRSTPEYRSYLFNTSHPRASPDTASSFETAIFSYDLLDALSILKGNDRELHTMYIRQQTLMSSCLAQPHKFEDFRNLLAVLSQLYQDCKARAERLRTTYPKGAPENAKQRHAQVYRDSQSSIVETAALVCEYVLATACSNRPREKILRDLEEHTTFAAIDNLRSLLKQHTVITRQNELLSADKIIDFLPEDNASMCRKVTREIESYLLRSQAEEQAILAPASPTSPTKRKRSPNHSRPGAKASKTDTAPSHNKATKSSLPLGSTHPSPQPSPPNRVPTINPLPKPQNSLPLSSTKTRLSLTLAHALHLYLSGILLPQRLKSWLEILTSWYPPDDPNWNYVPGEGPYEEGEEPPGGLMGLLRARKTFVGEGEGREGSDGRTERERVGGAVSEESLQDSTTEEGQNSNCEEFGQVDLGKVKQWLKPDRICWAWNVMEEEGVVVSKDVLRMASGEGDKARGERSVEHQHRAEEGGESGVDFLLYCMQ